MDRGGRVALGGRRRWRRTGILICVLASLGIAVALVTAGLPGSTAGAVVKPRTYWSGYVVNRSSYRSVSAAWVEPTARCYGRDQDSAIWVGLGGWLTGGIEQTGSDVACYGSTAHYGAWYELLRGGPGESDVFREYTNEVRPGDQMRASVSARGGGRYTLVLADLTAGWTRTKRARITGGGASRDSAEVIYEDRGSFPDVGTIGIENARVDGAALGHLHPFTVHATKPNGVPLDTTARITHRGRRFSLTVFPPSATDPRRLALCLSGLGYRGDLATTGHLAHPLEPISAAVTGYLRVSSATGSALAEAMTYARIADAQAADEPITDSARADRGARPRLDDSTLSLPAPGASSSEVLSAGGQLQACA